MKSKRTHVVIFAVAAIIAVAVGGIYKNTENKNREEAEIAEYMAYQEQENRKFLALCTLSSSICEVEPVTRARAMKGIKDIKYIIDNTSPPSSQSVLEYLQEMESRARKEGEGYQEQVDEAIRQETEKRIKEP